MSLRSLPLGGQVFDSCSSKPFHVKSLKCRQQIFYWCWFISLLDGFLDLNFVIHTSDYTRLSDWRKQNGFRTLVMNRGSSDSNEPLVHGRKKELLNRTCSWEEFICFQVTWHPLDGNAFQYRVHLQKLLDVKLTFGSDEAPKSHRALLRSFLFVVELLVS